MHALTYHTIIPLPVISCIPSLVDTAGQHSPLFAVMADGIPLFGPLGDNGSILTLGTSLSPSTSATTLDVCGGHVDTTYPYYHYHLPYSAAGNYSYPL